MKFHLFCGTVMYVVYSMTVLSCLLYIYFKVRCYIIQFVVVVRTHNYTSEYISVFNIKVLSMYIEVINSEDIVLGNAISKITAIIINVYNSYNFYNSNCCNE